MKYLLIVLTFLGLAYPQRRENLPLSRTNYLYEDKEYFYNRTYENENSNDTISWRQLNGPMGGIITSLFTKGDTIIVGCSYYHGSIYYSYNSGITWKKSNIKVNRCSDIIITKDSCFIITGVTSGLYKSNDLITWKKLNVPENDYWSLGKDLNGVLYTGTTYTVGYENNTLCSTNNGETWFGIPTPQEARSIVTTKKNTVLMGDMGYIHRRDSLDNWTSYKSDITNNFTYLTSDSNAYYGVVQYRDVFVASLDDGLTWKNRDTNSFFSTAGARNLLKYKNILLSALEAPDQKFYNWGIAISDDDGYNWRLSNNGLFRYASGKVLKASGDTVYLGLWGGGLYRTLDSGNSWQPWMKGLPAASTHQILIEDETIIAVSWGEGIQKSTDLGESWEFMNNGINMGTLYSLVRDDSGYLYAGGELLQFGKAALYKSTNNGTSWDSIAKKFPYFMYKDKKNRIYSFDYWDGIYRSSDQGKSWLDISYGLENFAVFGFAEDTLTGDYYAGTVYGTIYKSIDDCRTWRVVKRSTHQRALIGSIIINKEGHIFAANSYVGIERSTNHGLTWELMNNGIKDNADLLNLAINKKGELFATSDKYVFYSSNNGVDWHDISGELRNTQINYIAFDKNDKAYFSTEQGIWRLDKLVITSINESENLISNYSLSQNYPNPFNPSTTIKYSIPERGIVTIKVFDLLGREIRTLINEEKQTGSYEVTFNAEGLPSGIYFYSIHAGKFSETRKMLLVK